MSSRNEFFKEALLIQKQGWQNLDGHYLPAQEFRKGDKKIVFLLDSASYNAIKVFKNLHKISQGEESVE